MKASQQVPICKFIFQNCAVLVYTESRNIEGQGSGVLGSHETTIEVVSLLKGNITSVQILNSNLDELRHFGVGFHPKI